MAKMSFEQSCKAKKKTASKSASVYVIGKERPSSVILAQNPNRSRLYKAVFSPLRREDVERE